VERGREQSEEGFRITGSTVHGPWREGRGRQASDKGSHLAVGHYRTVPRHVCKLVPVGEPHVVFSPYSCWDKPLRAVQHFLGLGFGQPLRLLPGLDQVSLEALLVNLRAPSKHPVIEQT
jgi:hypothetical protein